MKIPIFQVDAFTDRVFGGNSAAVCPLNKWLDDEIMQKIAGENAVAETAFFVPKGDFFEIRWFTPDIEMDLCGHATMAAAHVITSHLNPGLQKIHFLSASGELQVEVIQDMLVMSLPSRPPVPAAAPQDILDSFAYSPLAVLKARDYVLVFENEKIIRELKPDLLLFNRINLDPGGVVVTAGGEDCDFVSRFFTPQASILEDPVTGSAHCSLIPYWSGVLGKIEMTARQLSVRGGSLFCKNAGERVLISGRAVTYLKGEISI
jgi:PhzF family phenazine biosynthesis protein